MRRKLHVTGFLDDVADGEWESHDSRGLGGGARRWGGLTKVVFNSHSTKPGPPRLQVQPEFLAVALNNSRLCPDPAGLAHRPAPSVPYPPSEMPALSEAAGVWEGCGRH